MARISTLGPACSDRERFKTASCKWVLVVDLGELFHIAVNDFDAQKSVRYSSVADPGFSPGGGAPTPKSAIIFQFFPENCMKMKEFGPPGGARVPGAPP